MKEKIEAEIIHCKHSVHSIIIDTMNDINEYLLSDVPLESYQEDIDIKLNDMKNKILDLF